MILKYSKVVVVIVAIMYFSSCKNLKLIGTYKKTHISGLPNQNNYKIYTINVEGKSDFKVISIQLISSDATINVKKYSFINLKDYKGHTVLDSKKFFEKGNYEFSFRIDVDKNKSNETVKLEYIMNNKLKTLHVVPIQKENFFNK